MINSTQVDLWIDRCQEFDYCWLAGFLKEALNNQLNLHWWPDNKSCILDGEVVVLNDEIFADSDTLTVIKYMHFPPNVILITSNEQRYKELLFYKFNKVIWLPHTHWFFNIIGLRKLNFSSIKSPGNRIFNFLNRRWNPGRLHMIEQIFRFYPELLDSGYVTAGTFSYYKDHPKIQTDDAFLDFYYPQQTCIENNNFIINGVSVTSNTKNFIHLMNVIPGIISIQVETFFPNEYYLPVTEKSMIALATGQIPIIVGLKPGHLQNYLKDQGFDIFDDIIDQSYDLEPDYFRRCELAINLNVDYLAGNRQIPNLTERFKYNQQHLLNTWCNQSLSKLVDNINQLCYN